MNGEKHMKLLLHSPAKALSKAYLRQSLRRDQIDLFKSGLVRLFERIRTDEHEEHLKNIVSDFLKDTWYRQTNEINTSGRTDLVIHNGKSSSDTVGVLVEVKRPGNNSEMIAPEKPNAKALHELLHYYMQERYVKGNMEVRRLIVCNIHEWYIFDASDFERLFFHNRKFVENYQKWNDGLFSGNQTDWLYREILKPFIENELETLPCTYFNLKEYARCIRKLEGDDDKKLIALYKLLSPPHLLKQSFANDANSLNREFYNELLHIIGLEEVKEKGKKLISRKAVERRNEGSLLENAINMLMVQRSLGELDHPEQFGSTDDERLFSIGLELCITWLNRILFLKLLEGQLIAYHQGDRGYAFLKNDKIKNFDDLQELFFEVLARRMNERPPSVAAKFGAIPYLNSSLFEISDLERKTIQVSNLKGRLEMLVHGATVLKDVSGKRISGSRNTLGYLFDFLDAYDFASEGKADIQETAKTIINASVLGLIFEKINGYRDGSFYTPGFITMYMSREAIRRAVVQKFCDANLPGCQNLSDFDDLNDKLDYTDKEVRQRANDIINSLRICDPAVGSGHFLVSALNELIAVKSDLRILTAHDGKRLHGCVVTIENDELIVTVEDELFVYNPKDPESRQIQEALFHEKQTIIEQCLFGVDINPKSVAICRLRLWIELLKNAYYTKESVYAELETLPNIDINIKCGNSLISRFALSGNQNVVATERGRLKDLTERYSEKVWFYKQAPANKAILRKEIATLKEELLTFAVPTDKDLIALRKIKNDVDQLGFGFTKEEIEKRHDLMAKEERLEKIVEEKQRTVYGNAFEWCFEFPEVLDENGEFVGFDVVIGNPPYMRADGSEELLSMRHHIIASSQYETLWEKWDLYVPFMELGYKLLRKNGIETMIVSDAYCHAKYAQKSQEWFLKNSNVVGIDFIGSLDIFDEASVHNVICFFQRCDGDANHPARRLHVGEFGTVRLLSTDEQRSLTHRVFFPESAVRSESTNISIELTKICYVSYGIAASSDEKKYKGEFVTEDVVSTTQDETHPKRYIEGKDVKKWYTNFHKFLEWGTDRAPVKYRRPTFLELHEAPQKLMTIVVTGGEPPVMFDDLQRFTTHTSCIFVPWNSLLGVRNNSLKKVARYHDEPSREDLPDRQQLEETSSRFSIKYILAVMNSSVARNFLRANRRSNIHLYPDDWKKLPIPDVSEDQQTPIILLVDQIIAARQADPKADISLLETELDRLVSALYDPTVDEIAVVEGTV